MTKYAVYTVSITQTLTVCKQRFYKLILLSHMESLRILSGLVDSATN